MHYVTEDALLAKHNEMSAAKAPGTDLVTKADYSENVEKNIKELVSELKTFRYYPVPLKRVYIPKANGKKRPLALPAYRGKLVQGVLTDILNCIYEPMFCNCSHGYRINRNCHTALKSFSNIINNSAAGIKYVVEMDIKGFFDHVDHDLLTEMLKLTIKDWSDKINVDTKKRVYIYFITSQKFSDYLLEWADNQKGKKDVTTSSTYATNIKGIIAPYFANTNITMEELQPIHLQRFYDTQYKRILTKGKNKGKPVSKNTVHHYHSNIHKALNDAVKLGIIPNNPDDQTVVEAPDEHIADFYNEEEASELLEKVKGHPLEVIVTIATCYGLRRSEIIGLKWSAINFNSKTITIQHKVTQATVDNKRVIVQRDKMKNKASHASLPLIPIVEKLLLREKTKQERNRLFYGNTYKNKDGYICVKDDGELVKPDTITDQIPNFIESVGLRRITLHNLRHSCASILLANGVSMKEIQEWLRHSDYSTTANIYSHLDKKSKENSANTINNIFEDKIIA